MSGSKLQLSLSCITDWHKLGELTAWLEMDARRFNVDEINHPVYGKFLYQVTASFTMIPERDRLAWLENRVKPRELNYHYGNGLGNYVKDSLGEPEQFDMYMEYERG